MNRLRQSAIPGSAWRMAAFTVVSLSLFGLLATLIGNISFVSSRTFHAEFVDATGVTSGDRVRLAGVEVGRVNDVELTAAGDRQLAVVSFTVEDGVPIYETAQLFLRYENIVGQRYLEIQEQPSDGALMEAEGTFDESQTSPALNLTVLFNGFQPLFRALEPEQVNRISGLIVAAVQGEGSTYESLLASTARLTNTLADKDAVIGQVVDNLGSVLQTIDARDTQLTSLIVTFRQLMGGLAQDRETIGASLPGLADLLTVSAGYVAEIRSPLADDIDKLGKVAGHLDRDRDVLDQSLKRLPIRERALARTGGYGSTFNFFVCGLSMNLRLLGEDYLLQTPSLSSNERDTVCARGGPQ